MTDAEALERLKAWTSNLRARIVELERENTLLQHELTGVRNTLEAVGREKDELARDAERWRECERRARWLQQSGYLMWSIPFVVGDSFAEAIDAAIAKRKETT